MSDQFFEDKDIQCIDCSAAFTWTASEQQFYSERSFSQPKRCAPCRVAKKEARDQGLARQQRGQYEQYD